MKETENFFVSSLLEWASTIDRPMPWKGIKNPYLIWLSEIIMQQTRVEQGLAYYSKFARLFPSVFDLAQAPLEEVLKAWEGLGYYSRARNLHQSAKFIVDNYQGVFPKSYQDVLALKGVGTYTAAAITSFAYGLPYAAVDGNVIRVITRFFGIKEAFDSSIGRKKIELLAQKILPQAQSAVYNQAIMDFGALVCKPKQALCADCLLRYSCVAFNKDLVDKLPFRANRTEVKEICFTYLVFWYKRHYYIRKRTTGFWKDLFEFYLLEGSDLMNLTKLKSYLKKHKFAYKGKVSSVDMDQKLSHRHIRARFFAIELSEKPSLDDFIKVDKANMSKFAFPKLINLYIENIF